MEGMEADEEGNNYTSSTKRRSKKKRIELGISCMLNTEVASVLAVLRRPPPDPMSAQFLSQEEQYDTALIHSFKSLRTLIFNPPQDWQTMDPAVYLTPFLDVIQSDEIPSAATAIALYSVLKLLSVGIFDERTTGARDAINSVVMGLTGCRLERTDLVSEDAVMMRILQILTAIMKHQAAILLTDQAVCTVVNTCFQVVQQSASRGDLLQRSARYTMHELVRMIFAKLQDIEVNPGDESETDMDDADFDGNLDSGYGIRCAVDIFHFLCSLLNVVEVVESEGNLYRTSDEDVQLFALVLINSAIELSGDVIGSHPKLLRMIQDDLFHHLIHYGASSSPLILSMICSTVLNIYHFLRRFVRLQLESFFKYVLLRVASNGVSTQLQEVALEGIIDFCRQPTFIIEAYVNYDCDPLCINVFEETTKLLCKLSFPGASPTTSLQAQAFEGLVGIVHNIAENINREGDSTPSGPYPVHLTEYSKFWKDRPLDNSEESVGYLRIRKAQKRKLMIASNHYSRDEKKGLEYLRLSLMFPNPPDPKDFAFFFRYTPGLDKTMIGDYLGDPDEFHIQVLKEFSCTFGFSGMVLDTALRTYLATFRLPGESQKIQRIMEAFSDQFHEQQSSDIFASKDAVFVLCYSLIMLNTDQHNPQVKKKMTEEEFIRNNRAINAGQDLPREYLSELFQSISSKAIALFGQTGQQEMNPGLWVELMSASRIMQPFTLYDFDRRLGRDMFASVAGPSVAALTAFFEQSDEDEMFHECVEALISVARIVQYGLEDTLDEMLASLSKCTTLLNPYASAEETLFAFSHDLKPRMAVLSVFSIANNFGCGIRGAWRPILDCLLKLKKLKLLPPAVVELDNSFAPSIEPSDHSRNDGGLIFPSHESRSGGSNRQSSATMISRFSHFLSLDSMEESLSLGLNEFEQNQKVIKQCQIGSIFTNSWNLPEDTLMYLGRTLIFASAGKGQKFATPIEEEETIEFCWDLISAVSFANINRLHIFWPSYHENLYEAIHFPMFSSIPFAEKVIMSLFRICLKLLSSARPEKLSEELIFKSINMMWQIEKQILDTCCESITKSVSKILFEYPANLQSFLGWKTVLHLLSVSGRHQETYDQGVETLIMLISDKTHVSRINYPFCIDCAFGFVALKNSPLEKNLKILDLLAESASLLIHWYKNFSDPGDNFSAASTGSNSFQDPTSFSINLFLKLGEAFRKTSLARREEIRNHAIKSLQKSFTFADELDFTPANCLNLFNLVIFAMVDDLHEKLIEYSRRDGAEREMRSMEGTLSLAMELLTEVYLQFLMPIASSPGFRTFWLGVLRRMDTCMKADLGEYGETKMQDVIPGLLKKMIIKMKEDEILVQKEEDDLFEITYIQIQWIAPSLKEELFPELEI
ncbi:ARF guanine-nucleotide exchange factor GNL2 [Linum perenne]